MQVTNSHKKQYLFTKLYGLTFKKPESSNHFVPSKHESTSLRAQRGRLITLYSGESLRHETDSRGAMFCWLSGLGAWGRVCGSLDREMKKLPYQTAYGR
jgi:hypothetical protein